MLVPLTILDEEVCDATTAVNASQGGRCSQHKYVTDHCWSSFTATDSPSLLLINAHNV
jgi:hypothetical protein